MRWLTFAEYRDATGLSKNQIMGRARRGSIDTRWDGDVRLYALSGDELDAEEADTEYDVDYVYDDARDVYVFLHPPGHRKPVAMAGDKVRTVVSDYSNDGGGLTRNELARRHGLSRSLLTYLLRALGHTHDALPYTRETIAESAESDLVDDLLQRKADRITVAAQRREWARVKRDADRWRHVESEILERVERALANREVAPADPVGVPETDPKSRPFAAVLSANDWHIGQRTAASESTDGGYDIDVCVERALAAVRSHVANIVGRYGHPEMWYVPLGDFVHADTWDRTTTRGTKVGGHPMADQLEAAVELSISLCECLRQTASVVVIPLQGNHDRLSALWLRHVLEAWFRNALDVTVADTRRQSWATEYGSSLLHFSHGDEVRKVGDLPSRVSVDFAPLWGRADHRYAFVGHRHHTLTQDLPGLRVLQAPSLAGRSAWEEFEGYRSPHECAAYVIDRERGHVAQLWAAGD